MQLAPGALWALTVAVAVASVPPGAGAVEAALAGAPCGVALGAALGLGAGVAGVAFGPAVGAAVGVVAHDEPVDADDRAYRTTYREP
jgi:hypothetical protein